MQSYIMNFFIVVIAHVANTHVVVQSNHQVCNPRMLRLGELIMELASHTMIRLYHMCICNMYNTYGNKAPPHNMKML